MSQVRLIEKENKEKKQRGTNRILEDSLPRWKNTLFKRDSKSH